MVVVGRESEGKMEASVQKKNREKKNREKKKTMQ